MPAPAPQAPATGHAHSGAADPDGARRRESAGQEQALGHELAADESQRPVVAHAYTAAGRAVQEPEARPGISVLA